MPNQEKNELASSNLYKKSNFLISAKYKSNLIENKILAYSLSNIKDFKEDETSHILYSEIKASDLKSILGGNNGSFYNQLKETAAIMTGRVIGMTNSQTKTFEFISIISHAKYEDSVLKIGWNPLLKNYLTNLESNFTLLNLNLMVSFQSIWSFRLYELIKSKSFNNKYEDKSNMDFTIKYSISELKFEIGVADASIDPVRKILDNTKNTEEDYDRALEVAQKADATIYDTWADFKRKVLDTAVKEINESPLSEMNVYYETTKSGLGGKTSGIILHVHLKGKDNFVEEEHPQTTSELDDLIDEVRDFMESDFKSKEIRVLLQAAENDVDRIKKAYECLLYSNKEITNRMGFMIDAIKNGYTLNGYTPKSKKDGGVVKDDEFYYGDRSNSFCNFKQNKIDFDALKEKCLAN